MEKIVYVQGGKRVDFENNETNERINGLNVFYYEKELDPDQGFGMVPSKQWIKPEQFGDFVNGAGYYKMKIDIEKNGARPKLVISGFEFLGKEKPSDKKILNG